MAPQYWSAGFDGDGGFNGHVVRDWSLEDAETIHCCSSESVPAGGGGGGVFFVEVMGERGVILPLFFFSFLCWN